MMNNSNEDKTQEFLPKSRGTYKPLSLDDKGSSIKAIPLTAVDSPEDYYDDEDDTSPSRISVPVGNWKDGLCDCCKFGCCHPMLCNACFCPLILAAQVMTRLRLDWAGNPTSEARARTTFRIVLYILLAYIFVCVVLARVVLKSIDSSIASSITDSTGYSNNEMDGVSALSVCFYILIRLLSFAFGMYCFVVMIQVRAHIRARSSIPPTCFPCGILDDFVCVLCCRCCTVAQMARHTTDYGKHPGTCCSSRGVPEDVPSIV